MVKIVIEGVGRGEGGGLEELGQKEGTSHKQIWTALRETTKTPKSATAIPSLATAVKASTEGHSSARPATTSCYYRLPLLWLGTS